MRQYFGRLGTERLAVPVQLVLDLREALALQRAGDDRGRLALALGRTGEHLQQILHTVTVDHVRVPAERLGASLVHV